jgi:hypothetical protein
MKDQTCVENNLFIFGFFSFVLGWEIVNSNLEQENCTLIIQGNKE